MKIAIVGHGPLGIECALAFQELGAHTVLFGHDRSEESLFGSLAKHWKDQASDGTWGEITSEQGRELLSWDRELGEVPSLKEYWESYLLPLSRHERILAVLKPFEVIRIQKRLLSPTESIQGRSRLADLFRVVFERKTEEGLEQQLQENPEAFENLDQGIVQSLREGIEQFEDFDLVVDARGPGGRFTPMGASGTWAINEKKLKEQSSLFYGTEVIRQWDQLPEYKSVAVVGSGLWAARVLLGLKEFLENEQLREIYLVTSEVNPFESIDALMSPQLRDELNEFLYREQEGWKQTCQQVEKQIQDWRALPDYERVKISCPEFPEPRLKMLGGYSVTSVDRLLDREGTFLTLETESWRREETASLVTIGIDAVVVANGLQFADEVTQGLRLNYANAGTVAPETGIHEEPGFYTLGVTNSGHYHLKYGMDQVQLIRQNALTFFSRG